MKRILLLVLLAAGLSSFGQIRKLPAAVTETFKEKYPNASNVEWKDKLTLFVASFEDGGKKYEARFSNKGVWQQTEDEITEAELPEGVKEGLEKSKYAEWEKTTIYHIWLPKEQTQYRISVKKSDLQKKNLLFSNGGRLLKDNITL
jgi:hypothetical protein